MVHLKNIEAMKKEQRLSYMLVLLGGQLDSETDALANLSNASAILYAAIENLNWAGFYLLKGDHLVLGPFQGLPACNRIPLGKGVCGTGAAEKRSVLVADVHEFPGHIACDAASNSELVVPICDAQGQLKGVIDLDSPKVGRFTVLEQEAVERFAHQLGEKLNWQGLI